MFTVILLAGGFGTRIRELHPDVPKPMIPVAGRPFLEWALRYWKREGATRAIVSLGHLAHVAEAYLQTRPPDGLEILTVTEPHAMGTGGAVRFAAARAALSDPFAVANADSLIVADTRPARDCLRDTAIGGALLGVPVPDTSRYGSLAISPDSRLLGFREKQPGAGLINAGVYFFRPRLLPLFAEKTPLSMEVDVFPALLAAGARLHVLPADAPFLDIGTPESLREAGEFVRRNLE
ncbi:MAG: D-glycero-alpha-D-manno-heptose 1-phosphate guanylyltransferase [Anaerolineales bacterium]|nr:D-glycero-alpha-D-manno-heptose 1-phosphate guanylyltransferase [Anaerolineales bacterium]